MVPSYDISAYSPVQWLFLFYLYSFLGWCFESTVVSLNQHPPKWVNRGFMHGPFLPLYGSGAVMMLVVSAPFQDNLLLTFVAGFLGATVLEYVTGVTMESLFKIRYWDYSDKPLNFHGHICLGSSVAWGFLTIVMTKVLHKGILFSMDFLPETAVRYIVIVLSIYITVDFTLSFKAALDLRDILVKLEKVREEAAKLQERMDLVSEKFGSGLTNVGEKIGTKVDAASEVLTSKISVAGSGITNRIESVSETLSGRLDQMAAKMEDKLSGLREKRAEGTTIGAEEQGSTEMTDTVRRETTEIRDRLLVVKSKLVDLLDIRDRFKRRMLLGNPSMRSERFKASLEELKAAVKEKTGKR